MMSDACCTIRVRELSEATREKLLEVIAELLWQIASLEKKGAGQQKSITRQRDELKKSRDQLKEIREQLEEAQRSAHRQAAPFRVDEKKRQKAGQIFKKVMPELSENRHVQIRQSLENEADRLLVSRRVEPSEA